MMWRKTTNDGDILMHIFLNLMEHKYTEEPVYWPFSNSY